MTSNSDVKNLAYLKMIEFLNRYVGDTYDLTAGEMLGSLDVNSEGVTMDPAAAEIWNEVWETVPDSQS